MIESIASVLPALKAGDLLVQDLDCAPLCEAIETLTDGFDRMDFAHVAIVASVHDQMMVVEAIGQDVHSLRIEAFLQRSEILPAQPNHPNADKDYYVVGCKDLQELPRVVPSRKPRRLLFIPTTLEKLLTAPEINFLFSESPLEELMWAELLRASIPAERQHDITVGRLRFKLDFAVFCKERNIDIECDGDKYHMSPEAVERDKRRSNALTSHGWADLRFTTTQLTTEMPATMSLVGETINRYGGLQDPNDPNEYRYVEPPDDPQPRLFG